jgi:hypothetical protein
MVRRAVAGFAVGLPLAAAAGWLAGGTDAAASAALGVGVVVANFVAHGLSLAWAAGVSIPVVQAVALGGFVVRMGTIVVALVVLDRTAFFSPEVFAVAALVSTVALLTYEARLVKAGVGAMLDIPADPAAVVAGERLRAKEEARR